MSGLTQSGRAGLHAQSRMTNTVTTNRDNPVVKLRPLYDRIVVDPIVEADTTTSGIIIPESAKEKPQTGRVMATGHGRRLENGAITALDVRVGDRILFGKYSGSNISVEGTEYVIIREDDVLGILFSAA